MKQNEVIKKIGTIIRELQEQYDFIESVKEDINDLELELFVANAHFLTDHLQVLRKLNALPKPPVRAAVELLPVVKKTESIAEPVAPEIKNEYAHIPLDLIEGWNKPYEPQEVNETADSTEIKAAEPQNTTYSEIEKEPEHIPLEPEPELEFIEEGPVTAPEETQEDEYVADELPQVTGHTETPVIEEAPIPSFIPDFQLPIEKWHEIIDQEDTLTQHISEEPLILNEPELVEQEQEEPVKYFTPVPETAPKEELVNSHPAVAEEIEDEVEPVKPYDIPEPELPVFKEPEKYDYTPEHFLASVEETAPTLFLGEIEPTETKEVQIEKLPVTINDLLSSRYNNQAAQASITSLPPIKDLKSAINLNDKLLYVKDLFNGYSMSYGEAIEILNRFNNYDEADRFLKTNYVVKNNWEARQATADKFYALLKRRFS